MIQWRTIISGENHLFYIIYYEEKQFCLLTICRITILYNDTWKRKLIISRSFIYPQFICSSRHSTAKKKRIDQTQYSRPSVSDVRLTQSSSNLNMPNKRPLTVVASTLTKENAKQIISRWLNAISMYRNKLVMLWEPRIRIALKKEIIIIQIDCTVILQLYIVMSKYIRISLCRQYVHNETQSYFWKTEACE